MADILIRMEMPKSCKCCPCYEQSLAFPDYIKRCKLGADLPEPWPLQYEKRGDNCPLHELPEHGDFIDKQTALAALHSDYAYAAMDIIEKEVPVVIPSNKEETDG